MEGRNSLNRYGATPFFLAAKSVDVPLMEALLELGADPFIANVDGDTPLMVAAGVGVYSQGESPGLPEESADAVKMLLDLGAPVNDVDKNGETALHGPAWRGSNEAVMLLVDAGAKLDVRNNRGWLPLTIADGVYYNARVMMNKHTAKLLRELMIARGLDASDKGAEPRRRDPRRSRGRDRGRRRQPVGDPAQRLEELKKRRRGAQEASGTGEVAVQRSKVKSHRSKGLKGSEAKATRRVAASLVLAGALVATAIATPAAQRRSRGDNSTHGAPVATNTIALTPDRFYGKLVTVSAAVDEMLSKTVFVIDQRKAAGAKEVKAVGSPLLVIAPQLMAALEQNRYFLVRGEVVKFSVDALAKTAAGYTLDLAPETSAKYEGQPVLVASSILDSKYAELVKQPEEAKQKPAVSAP